MFANINFLFDGCVSYIRFLMILGVLHLLAFIQNITLWPWHNGMFVFSSISIIGYMGGNNKLCLTAALYKFLHVQIQENL